MAYDHMDYCHNNTNNISEDEIDENVNPVTLQDNKDRNFDDMLINCVRSYPHLYDTSCKDYRDVLKKENSWKEISKVLNTSPDICCTRWTRLRESFSKEKKRRRDEMRSGSGASTRRGFIYFESMKFIDKFVKSRGSMTNIKIQEKYISDCSKDKSLNQEISNWIQLGKRTLEREKTPLAQIDTNTLSPLKKWPKPETSVITTNFDDTSCASFSSVSETNINDFTDQSSARSSPVINNTSHLTPTSEKSTYSFKKPCMKGKFNRKLSFDKDGKNQETEKDHFETSLINLNKAVLEHLNSKKHDQMPNDPDASFCNFVLTELKRLDDSTKQIKKQEIMQILWKKE